MSTVLLEPAIKSAIKTFYSNVKFDLILYSTPPITLVSCVNYVKRRDGAKSYLLLKDIFPQNAVDLGMMTTSGLKSFIYKYFRRKEKKLYAISDKIGCMSPANVEYVLNHNPEVSKDKVEVCPNAIEVVDKSVNIETRNSIRNKYEIPLDKTVFVYGGNLGKPQGIPFLIECLKAQRIDGVYFLIVGDGTEYSKLEAFTEEYRQSNIKLMKRLPKEDYDTLVAACDVGLIFLDNRFTIPNYPSRVLSYMQARLPILVCSDKNSDLGKTIEEQKLGWFIESENVSSFLSAVKLATVEVNQIDKDKVFHYLETNCNVVIDYNTIMHSIQ